MKCIVKTLTVSVGMAIGLAAMTADAMIKQGKSLVLVATVAAVSFSASMAFSWGPYLQEVYEEHNK